MGPKKDSNSIKMKRKMTRITIELKKEIIGKRENGVRVCDLATQYGMAKSTICTILKNKEIIKRADVARGVTVRTKLRSQTIEEVEKLLLIWINEKLVAGDCVSGGIICEKARRLHDDLVKKFPSMNANTNVFKASRGWLDKFKKRSGIHSTVRHREAMSSINSPPYRYNKIELAAEESRNEKLLKAMLYQMTPQTQSKLQQKINISAALGKPANTERSRKSPLDTASTSNSTLATKPIEVEDSSPPIKKAREIHIDIDISEDESTVVSKPPLQPAISVESPVQKSVATSVKPTPVQPSSIVHNPVLDINVPQKQKRILVVPNHQQSVMSNLSSLWKAGRLCDAFISNGTANVEVHKMILGAVCPKVLDVFYNTPQHKLPKVTFPSSVSKEALLAFAEYMYNGVLDLDPDMLTQMKVIAQRLDMKDFEQLCNNQLKSSMVPNIRPTILEPMLSEPCSSSGLLQQMSLEGNQTSVMDIISAPTRSHQKNVHTVNTIPSSTNSSVSLSNLPLVEVRAETDDSLMEVVNNNLALSVNDNICDINVNNRPQVKIEKIDPDDQQYCRETISSDINYSTPDSIITNNFTHFSNSDLSKSSSSSTTTQPTNSTLNKPLPVGHIWKQNSKDDGNLTENANPTDPYPINLFTANWANVPLLTQEIKKEYSVD